GATLDNKNNEALVVVDGIVRSMNDLNPADIESIEVLKDAASTAIYGARANGGVILVTTKKGKEGKSAITYNFKGGLNFAREGYEFVGAEEYLYYNRLGNKRIHDAGYNRPLSAVDNTTGYGVNAGKLFDLAYLDDSNKHLLEKGWQSMKDPYSGKTLIFQDHSGKLQKAAFRDPAFTQDHYLSFTGGNEKALFNASLGYYNEQGIVQGTGYERFTGTLTAQYKLYDNFTVNAGTTFSYTEKPALWIGEQSLFYRSFSMWPTWNPYDEDGNPAAGVGMADGNPLYWKEKLQRSNTVRRSTWNIGFSWDILPEKLTLKENSMIYYLDNYQESFNKKFQMQNRPAADETREAMAYNEKQVQQQHNITLNYKDTFSDSHNLNAMIGGEAFQYDLFKMKAATRNSPSDDIPTLNVGSERVTAESYKARYRILSAFGRANYDYEGKYLFSAVARMDGISKLSDNRWGFFPGVSGGWNVHEEDFFKESKVIDVISTLKPRISYGINGNVSGLGNFDVYGLYAPQTMYNGTIGYLNTALINSGLRWEKSKSFEVGLDLGFLNNRFNIIFDYYNRLTDDLLTNLDLPGYTGFGSIKTNLGALRNQGVELELRANIISNAKGFNWSMTAKVASVANKIVRLPENPNDKNRQGGLQVYDPKSQQYVWVGGYQEGGRLGDIYAYKQDGIFRDWDHVKAVAGDRYDAIAELYGPNKWASMTDDQKKGKKPIEPGDVIWADLDGNGVINSFDQVKVGNIFPKVTGGFSTTFSYKNWSLYGRFDYALGHTLYNDLLARTLGQYQGSFNLPTEIRNTWSETNTGATLPKFYYADQLAKKNITRSNNANPNLNSNSSRFYEKGDYLALRELTLNYQLPATFLSKIKMQAASVYVTGQNLFYITGYSGTSPEPALNPDTGLGVDQGRYPMPKTVLVGLNVTF
ncbi:MAG: SusC/RagA family TonB-linked outer membrane protein, partial [Bacteroidales bacterium]